MVNLCIGTAQFGSSYGISNTSGKINDVEITKIFSILQESKIQYLDTAPSYGNAEERIGLLNIEKNIKIISKFTIKKNLDPIALRSELKKSVKSSLISLKQSSLYSLLIHNPYDLNKEQIQCLIDTLSELKDLQLVRKVGFSIYNKEDLFLTPLDCLDVIQLPISIFDQRSSANHLIDHLESNNIEIHARSIFMQGLVFTKELTHSFFSKDFRMTHQAFHNYCRTHDISSLCLSLAFIKSFNKQISLALFGVSKSSELLQILDVWSSIDENIIEFHKKNFSQFQCFHASDLDPRLWQH